MKRTPIRRKTGLKAKTPLKKRNAKRAKKRREEAFRRRQGGLDTLAVVCDVPHPARYPGTPRAHPWSWREGGVAGAALLALPQDVA